MGRRLLILAAFGLLIWKGCIWSAAIHRPFLFFFSEQKKRRFIAALQSTGGSGHDLPLLPPPQPAR